MLNYVKSSPKILIHSSDERLNSVFYCTPTTHKKVLTEGGRLVVQALLRTLRGLHSVKSLDNCKIKNSYNRLYKLRLWSVCIVLLRLEKGCTNLRQTWHAYALKPGRGFRKVFSFPVPVCAITASGVPGGTFVSMNRFSTLCWWLAQRRVENEGVSMTEWASENG
jgi:hypothetical protein